MEDLILKQSLISTILLFNERVQPHNIKYTFEDLNKLTYSNLESIRNIHVKEWNKKLELQSR